MGAHKKEKCFEPAWRGSAPLKRPFFYTPPPPSLVPRFLKNYLSLDPPKDTPTFVFRCRFIDPPACNFSHFFFLLRKRESVYTCLADCFSISLPPPLPTRLGCSNSQHPCPIGGGGAQGLRGVCEHPLWQ